MHPILIELGPVTLYAYGLMMAVSFIVGIQVSARRAPAFGFTADQMHDSAIPVLVAGLVGSKLLYLVASREALAGGWSAIIPMLRGGFVYYGGVIGGVVGAILWVRRRGLPFLGYCDMVAPGMAFSLALGRLGCFLNGCCYGKPVAWGLVFPGLGDGVARHPTQLYELAAATILGLVLLRVPAPPADRRGRVWGWFLAAYAVIRFTIEMLRDDPRGPTLASLSVSQLLSLAGALAGVALLVRRPRPA